MKTYTTPAGSTERLYMDMLKNTHILVAGMQGSGKSVIIQGIIHTALFETPNTHKFILIDPKKVALIKYKNLPHTIAYASNDNDMIEALETAVAIMMKRYDCMQAQEKEDYEGANIWVIIDELADLMTTNKKQVAPLIQRLAQLGRAARVHVIAATQHPLTDVIPTCIKVNFDAKVGLHTECAQHSRNIIHQTGCELLPRYGKCYYITPERHGIQNVPRYSEEERQAVLDHWRKANTPAPRKGFFARLFG